MLPTDTEIRVPHDPGDIRRVKGKTVHGEPVDPRTSVTVRDHECKLQLFFQPGDLSGNADLLEVRILPDAKGQFLPTPLVPRMPLYLQYARAAMAGERGEAGKAVEALQAAGRTKRGISDDLLRVIAQEYKAQVAAGEPAPLKAIAREQIADVSTVSRWVARARDKGYLDDDDKAPFSVPARAARAGNDGLTHDQIRLIHFDMAERAARDRGVKLTVGKDSSLRAIRAFLGKLDPDWKRAIEKAKELGNA